MIAQKYCSTGTTTPGHPVPKPVPRPSRRCDTLSRGKQRMHTYLPTMDQFQFTCQSVKPSPPPSRRGTTLSRGKEKMHTHVPTMFQSQLTCQSTSHGMLSSIAPPSAEPEEAAAPFWEAAPEDLPKSSRRVFCLERRRSLWALDSLRLFCCRFSSFFPASLSLLVQQAPARENGERESCYIVFGIASVTVVIAFAAARGAGIGVCV